ncbi:MAG: DEAD/DEAH box helicase, partial [Desulforhabdus sp.]|nr:DEAD/DEAH box helicase [Desulforhabdus sp.]
MIQKFLNLLLTRQWQGAKIIHHAVLPDREGGYSDLALPLPDVLSQALARLGIFRLYSHQARALEEIRSGKNVVVATPTSSGKSLIYNLAVTETLLSDPHQRSLYLFPIKALSRDQLETLNNFFAALESEPQFRCAVYDGDTSPYQRAKIRQHHPHILLTNPDMLHYALLPYHSKWEAFWRKLRYVVLDELHTYRGIFGSHVAQIFRRFQRICRFYGSNPQFVLLSATIANPKELAEQLIGSCNGDIAVIRDHGTPQTKRHFIFMQPDEAQGSYLPGLAARLLVLAAQAGLKTIAFTQSRKLTELLHLSVTRTAPGLAKKVSSYRAGFLPEERRVIEQKLANGSLSAVISTSALEMGIDVGGLDVCILVGYPGTVMNTWQRGGRVGRGGQESAIILLPQLDALDQYIVQHPEQFLKSGYELAVTDPLNEEILKAHLPCAAAELPLEIGEREWDHDCIARVVNDLTTAGRLLQTADGDRWLSRSQRPHREVDIRSIGSSYTILRVSEEDKKIPLGKSDGMRAFKECHPGAVYLHRGMPYQVESLDLKNRLIHVTSNQVPYFTRVKSEKETEILDALSSKPVANFIVRLGRLRVTEKITGYEKRRFFSQELLGFNPLDLPEQVFETVGLWLEIEPLIAARIQASKLHFMGGIHAIEHAMISMFPLFALCDRNDIGGIASPNHPQVGKSAIFIYDGFPGGIGLAARGYEIILPLLEKTRDLVSGCACTEGCPACIHSPKCGAGNKPLDKRAALAIMNYLTGTWTLAEPPTDAALEAEEQSAISACPAPTQESTECRIGFFDIETQRLAQEVGGWQNKHLMRLSVAVIYEIPAGTFHVYKEDDVFSLIRHLQKLDLVVGFNLIQFDYEVLKAYTSIDFNQIPTFDILGEIQQRLGFRLSLDHLATCCLGKCKSADGVQAVSWLREGKWDLLIDYCKDDVILTR